MRALAGLILLAVLAVVATGCSLGCSDAQVQLVTSQQNPFPAAVLGPGESFSNDKVLPPGSMRSIGLCLSRYQTAKFRAFQNGVEVAEIHCVVFQANYEASTPQVIWTPVGLQCSGW